MRFVCGKGCCGGFLSDADKLPNSIFGRFNKNDNPFIERRKENLYIELQCRQLS